MRQVLRDLATPRAARVEGAISEAVAVASGVEAIMTDASGWWFIFAMFVLGTVLLLAVSKALAKRPKGGPSCAP